MLIDSDRRGPGILPCLQVHLEAVVEGFKHEACAHAECSLDSRQVHEVLTGPKHVAFEALGGSGALLNAGNVFRKRLLAVFAPEATLFNDEKDDLITDRGVFDRDFSAIVDGAAERRATGAEGYLGRRPNPVMYPRSFPRKHVDHF